MLRFKTSPNFMMITGEELNVCNPAICALQNPTAIVRNLVAYQFCLITKVACILSSRKLTLAWICDSSIPDVFMSSVVYHFPNLHTDVSCTKNLKCTAGFLSPLLCRAVVRTC